MFKQNQKIFLIAFYIFLRIQYRAIRNSGDIQQAVVTAIEAGYRHIDTAPLYYDEDDIGNAIIDVTSRGIVVREELFITTKVKFSFF